MAERKQIKIKKSNKGMKWKKSNYKSTGKWLTGDLEFNLITTFDKVKDLFMYCLSNRETIHSDNLISQL